MGRRLWLLVGSLAVVGVAAGTARLVVRPVPAASLLPQGPAPSEVPLVPDRLPPGVVDASGNGLISRLFTELNPDLSPPGEWPLFTTRGPLTQEQLDAIRHSRPGENVVYVLAYDPTLPSGPWTDRPGDIVTHKYTPGEGWQAFPSTGKVVKRRERRERRETRELP